jgi:hypothetical protein
MSCATLGLGITPAWRLAVDFSSAATATRSSARLFCRFSPATGRPCLEARWQNVSYSNVISQISAVVAATLK